MKSRVIKFSELKYSEEFIINPENVPENEDVIVFWKGLSAKGDCGVSVDINRTVKRYFDSDEEVILVSARKIRRRQ